MLSIYWILIIIFFLMSIIGVFIPMIPDIIPIWVGVIIYQFGPFPVDLPAVFWVVLVIVTLITILSDFLANAIAVKKSGGSNIAVVAALIGLALGLIILGPLGIIVGPFAAIFLTEYYRSQRKDYNQPLKIAFSTVFAFIGSGLVKIILIMVVIIWFFMITI